MNHLNIIGNRFEFQLSLSIRKSSIPIGFSESKSITFNKIIILSTMVKRIEITGACAAVAAMNVDTTIKTAAVIRSAFIDI